VLRAATRKVERITTIGPWIGIRENIRALAIDSVMQLEPGDVMVLYTDGIIETADDQEDMFGMDRLCAAVEEAQDGTPEQIRDHVIAKVREFSQVQNDDMTILVARYRRDREAG
jgi:serine phosphatase RsbU (regulator of sigma subunit)